MKFFKIRFILHPTFYLVVFFYILCGEFIIFAQYFVALLLHELSHAFIARRLGYKMNKIVLYPFGLSLSGEDDEFSFNDEIKISLAGPIMNILLCICCLALWWIEPISYYYTSTFCVVNMVCGLFNLLPIFPLDGGRVSLAILSLLYTRKQSVKIIKWVTLSFCVLIFGLFIVSLFTKTNFSFGVMAVVLLSSVLFEDRQTVYMRVCNMKFREKKLKKGIVERVMVIDENAMLGVALRHINSSFLVKFKVVDAHFAEKCVIDENGLLNLISKFGTRISFREAYANMKSN